MGKIGFSIQIIDRLSSQVYITVYVLYGFKPDYVVTDNNFTKDFFGHELNLFVFLLFCFFAFFLKQIMLHAQR